MESSVEMLNRTSYFPIYPYSLSDVSSLNSLPFRNNTYDYSSYYPENPSIVYRNTRSHSPINHSNPAEIETSFDRYDNNVLCLSMTRSDRCLICSDRASGIHFGISTCEACKAFFRRTSLSLYPFANPCSPVRCEINIKNRNNCPSCRFDKCKRLGMDRENVIYGKPSKQQIYQQDHFIEQLTKISNELIKTFQDIHSIYQISSTFSNNKQQIDTFGQIALQLFYQEISSVHIHSSDVIHQIIILMYKNNVYIDYCFIENPNLRAILSLWLFVYYYETFLFKQNISQEKLTILIKLLEMELIKTNGYYVNKQTIFRIDFINTFTKFSDLLQEIHLEN